MKGTKMQIGDKVEWTHVSTRGRTMSMSLQTGTLIALVGGLARVRVASGRVVQMAAARLRTPDQPSQIGEFVEAMRESAR